MNLTMQGDCLELMSWIPDGSERGYCDDCKPAVYDYADC